MHHNTSIMIELKEICVSGRCGLCRFELQLGNKIIAIRRSDTEQSQTYEYSILGFIDIALGIDITSGAKLAKILDVTSPVFEPSPLTDKRRLLWLQSWLAPIVERETRYLPNDISHDIAVMALNQQMARCWAVEYAIQSCAETRSEAIKVPTLGKIYAQYVEFEGIRA
ncbi:hypothetical protein CORC01_10787 [Colletotrichum orchidophilum]|uniref:Uncharacterized protein n=1 Tax=Colletotrichum orchidophilum TaxID=1209926 RepID=A0A1G4AXK1_9PEZI|nr:uncharacterized protein CORC01_10787 [Colletotrichum orchidophilum]OHE93888.1 hypothetical protein CORC01_10787 [Colletotrichum orchidophilum]